ncbi:1-acyl-sn-glycerol-3-phosphate acyltransferase [Lactobacillus selangorensis]|uniref:1-acyl-sn-glycerol-3-phosphate acyltransferase n=1 Tax=Lactobacillus selangorensis TaxID=81857 RepID=A0A0R2FM27_9LACO|nr:1-acyl-sn-glycerol-3-phosphate acyltransferase [Lactobacillus selangorensis]KRN29618.1 1-acyl-sn-glycerol-3-phosphate acyltransferase [Lactobacillus selangorensis]KRN33852.1 1-acyl-sn-glycerol-3-phosphate acyltransferase [Lactobacillus selangorensis]
MFFSFARALIRAFVWLINGNTHYENRDKLFDGPYILVGPHRTWWDPIFFALAASPRQFSFMAKEELFNNRFFRFVLVHAHAFPVNRKNPGPSAIKTPVRILKDGKLSLIMFPSGSRYSSELKGGATVIAKLSKAPLIPVVYQGPLKFRDLFLRKRITVRFGDPITVDPKLKLNDAGLATVSDEMQVAFDKLDAEIDPNFHYVPDEEKALKEKEEGKM